MCVRVAPGIFGKLKVQAHTINQLDFVCFFAPGNTDDMIVFTARFDAIGVINMSNDATVIIIGHSLIPAGSLTVAALFDKVVAAIFSLDISR